MPGKPEQQSHSPAPLRAKVFIALFMVAVGLPLLVFNLFSRTLSMDNHENRLLTTLPQVLEGGWRGLLPNLDTFLTDNSPFRYQLIVLDASLDYLLFGTTQSDQVLAGTEGWLFYKAGPEAARPMADYQGLPDRNDSEETLAAAAAALQRAGDTLAGYGCTLVLDITPSKDRIYREYMPAGYPIVNEMNRADRLVAYLRQHTTVPVNYSYAALRARALAAPEDLLYYPTDTHWNHAGALLALDGILQTVGLPVLPFEQYTFTEEPGRRGDLSYVAGLYALQDANLIRRAAGYETLFEQDPRTVGVVGDSFSQYYDDYLAARFDDSWRMPLAHFTPALAVDPGCQVMILCATERNADQLLELLAAF